MPEPPKFDPFGLLQALDRHRVTYIVIGAFARVIQGTEEVTRGPSAGGSGQDNVYLFDGANVSLPLFGNLSAEPASHDIAQLTVVNGGAKAVDFNRSGGFLIDSVSKSGTSAFHGQAGYQFQTSGMSAALNTVTRRSPYCGGSLSSTGAGGGRRRMGPK